MVELLNAFLTMLHKIKAIHEAARTFCFPSTLSHKLVIPCFRSESASDSPCSCCRTELSSRQLFDAKTAGAVTAGTTACWSLSLFLWCAPSFILHERKLCLLHDGIAANIASFLEHTQLTSLVRGRHVENTHQPFDKCKNNHHLKRRLKEASKQVSCLDTPHTSFFWCG